MGPRVYTIIPVYRGGGEFTYLLVESDEEGTVDQSLTLTFDTLEEAESAKKALEQVDIAKDAARRVGPANER